MLRKTPENSGMHDTKGIIVIDDLKQLKNIIEEIKK
jgi:hypothetical protein